MLFTLNIPADRIIAFIKSKVRSVRFELLESELCDVDQVDQIKRRN